MEGMVQRSLNSCQCFALQQKLTFGKGAKNAVQGKGIVRKISLMVRMGSNPHHSWLGLTEQQNLTLFRGEARVLVRGEG